jgi:hypothetical protein
VTSEILVLQARFNAALAASDAVEGLQRRLDELAERARAFQAPLRELFLAAEKEQAEADEWSPSGAKHLFSRALGKFAERSAKEAQEAVAAAQAHLEAAAHLEALIQEREAARDELKAAKLAAAGLPTLKKQLKAALAANPASAEQLDSIQQRRTSTNAAIAALHPILRTSGNALTAAQGAAEHITKAMKLGAVDSLVRPSSGRWKIEEIQWAVGLSSKLNAALEVLRADLDSIPSGISIPHGLAKGDGLLTLDYWMDNLAIDMITQVQIINLSRQVLPLVEPLEALHSSLVAEFENLHESLRTLDVEERALLQL